MPQLAKKVKRFLKANKVVLNVRILDASGNLIDSDIEDDLPDDPDLEAERAAGEDGATDAPGEPEAGQSTDAEINAKALAQRLVKAKSQIDLLPEAARKGLIVDLTEATREIQARNLEIAAEGVSGSRRRYGIMQKAPGQRRRRQLTRPGSQSISRA